MQLPPQQENEPEWLRVQRQRRQEEHNWNYGGWAAMAFVAVPYATWEALRAPPFVALVIAVAITTVAFIFYRRSVGSSFQRGFAIWSVAAHTLCAVVFLAMTARHL